MADEGEQLSSEVPPGAELRLRSRPLQRALRRARRVPERLLHPLRRTRAERLVTQATGPVLVLCHGNICRSPFAEATLRARLAARGVAVESAGLVGPGRAPPAIAREAASARGYDLSAHRSRLLDRDLATGAGLVVVMNGRQRSGFRARFGDVVPVLVLGDLDPEPIDSRGVVDPIRRDMACFTRVYERIERCTGRLAALLGTAARPRQDPAS